ncbi:MAG: TetR/AcrR family transcriptional regulator [Candidatus Kapaibacteriota bacterium]|jgi:AcrR family transcriptional regulator
MTVQDKREAKRADILRCAADVFSGTGFHATTIQEIATAAGIGKGTVYEYFRTKEELFLAVYDSWMNEYENTVRERVEAATDPVAKVDAVRQSAVDFYQSRAQQAPLLLEFWAHALRSTNPAFLERVHATRQFLQDLGADLAQQLVTAGWFTSVDAASFALLESGISDGIFLSWVLEQQRFPLDKAYTFRQSLIGMGLLTDEARTALRSRLSAKLKKGF